MANPTPPVWPKTCVLKVGINCCKGCQTTAKRKLLSVSGVTAVEYNAEQELLRVSGDVEPTTLIDKLTKWGKKAELVSVLGDISDPLPRTPEHYQKKPTKCFLLRCFGKRSSKVKVKPIGQYRGAWSENGSPTPFFNVAGPPPMVYPPPPRAMFGFPSPTPYPPPIFGARQQPPSPPYTADMFRLVPPQSPPYFQLRQTQFPHMVNSRLHYPRY